MNKSKFLCNTIFNMVCLLLLSNTTFAQKNLNLDFETINEKEGDPEEWIIRSKNNNYSYELDSLEVFEGKYALKVSSELEGNNSVFVSNTFPIEKIRGKKLLIKGRVKTEKVKRKVFLWLTTLNGQYKPLNLTHSDSIIGSNNWQEISVQSKIPVEAGHVTYGFGLMGNGEMWLDGVEIWIDGKRFETNLNSKTSLNEEERKWLGENIIPLQSIYPNATNNEDLEQLRLAFGTSFPKILALGESTHGTKEFFLLKHRLIKYFAEEGYINTFAMEASAGNLNGVDEYIHKSIEDSLITNPIESMSYIIWRTKEIRDLFDWMKQFNQQSEMNMEAKGFDMKDFEEAITQIEQLFPTDNTVLHKLYALQSNLSEFLETAMKQKKKIAIPSTFKEKAIHDLQFIRDKITEHQTTEKSSYFYYVRIIEQFIDKDLRSRDQYMAENILHIVKHQDTISNTIVWAHNGHVQNNNGAMGATLKDKIGEDYLSIGLLFYEGNYSAYGKKGFNSQFAEQPFPGTYELILNSLSLDTPGFFLDLRKIKRNNPETIWFFQNLFYRRVGSTKNEKEFIMSSLPEDFDFLLFLKEGTSSTIIKEEYHKK